MQNLPNVPEAGGLRIDGTLLILCSMFACVQTVKKICTKRELLPFACILNKIRHRGATCYRNSPELYKVELAVRTTWLIISDREGSSAF